jgi:phage terminase large subunit-like protein
MNIQTLTAEELTQIKLNRAVRRMLARKSHFWFFSIYLSHYMKYPFAPFHHDIFALTEDEKLKLAVLVVFRGGGKSTLITLSHAIWSIIGIQQKKFVLILSQTQAQARLLLTNIRRELENNKLLKDDIGPFEEVSDEWGATSIVISNYGARITIASTEQSVRGLRHGEHRPDLVLVDDAEDLNSVRTKEGRDKTFNWFTGEVLPIGDKETKFIIVGNLLHEDSLLMRLRKMINEGKLEGKFFAYPLLDNEDNIAWSGKFPTLKDVERLKATIGSDSAWFREYLLKIISDTDRVVHPEWIKYYDSIPQEQGNAFRYTATGMDLAISQKDSADCTAMVSAKVFGRQENLKVYILPNPVNKHLTFPETVQQAIQLSKVLGEGTYTKLFIENVGYQDSLVQHLASKNIPAEGINISGQDKQSRLALITHLIQQGKVLFSRKGDEELIMQLTGFGIEIHDDLADAFSLLLLKIMSLDSEPEQQVLVIDASHFYDYRRNDLRNDVYKPISLNDEW